MTNAEKMGIMGTCFFVLVFMPLTASGIWLWLFLPQDDRLDQYAPDLTVEQANEKPEQNPKTPVQAKKWTNSAGLRGVFRSPDGRTECFNVAGPDGRGTHLYIRSRGSKGLGLPLRSNDRWMRVFWSPDSQMVAVEDHSDGHISDVYVYRVQPGKRGAGVNTTLVYHTPRPGTYDVNWEVVGWDTQHGRIRLRRHAIDYNKPIDKRVSATNLSIPFRGAPITTAPSP